MASLFNDIALTLAAGAGAQDVECMDGSSRRKAVDGPVSVPARAQLRAGSAGYRAQSPRSRKCSLLRLAIVGL